MENELINQPTASPGLTVQQRTGKIVNVGKVETLHHSTVHQANTYYTSGYIPGMSGSASDPAPSRMEMPKMTSAEEEQTADEVVPLDTKQPQQETALEQFLISCGLSTDRAITISSVVNSSANLRIAYNELRKAFGATDGRAYLALVKEYRSISTN